MSTAERISSEREFHDRQAAERAHCFADGSHELRFDDADYLDHETWVRPAFGKLGDLRGKAALDYGCGHGMAAVVMARRGAAVSAFDLSPGYVAEAAERAAANGVSIEAVAADAEQLPFADGSFDAVWGSAILHHLDLGRAASELRRVMRPGAVGVFCEPWGENPVLEMARRFVPYPNKHRTRDEVPLRKSGLRVLREAFPGLTVEGFQLFGAARRVWKNGRALDLLDRLDALLTRRMPALEMWCRYVVLTIGRPNHRRPHAERDGYDPDERSSRGS